VIKPLLARWLGQAPEERPQVTATLTRKVVSRWEMRSSCASPWTGRQRIVATPLPGGAGVLMSLVRADGIVRIPRGEEGYDAGAPVAVSLLRSPAR